ncbi:MAG: PspC domain-containing protein [Spirochaetales bacterium]|nr:PspC domain-containing protein [Spirochaetales bacterium]
MTQRLYRARNGKFLGVCRGIADWKDFPVKMVRLGFILAAIFTSFVPVAIVYLIMAFFLEPAPTDNFTGYRERDREEKEEPYSRFKSRFNSMKEDLNNRERDWEQRFRDSD